MPAGDCPWPAAWPLVPAGDARQDGPSVPVRRRSRRTGLLPLDSPVMTPVFHLAINVTDLDTARRFYGGVLGCREGRSTATWVDFDFFGHQLSLHLGTPLATQDTGRVGDHLVPMPHFGLAMLLPQWQALAARLRAAGLAPQVRFTCVGVMLTDRASHLAVKVTGRGPGSGDVSVDGSMHWRLPKPSPARIADADGAGSRRSGRPIHRSLGGHVSRSRPVRTGRAGGAPARSAPGRPDGGVRASPGSGPCAC